MTTDARVIKLGEHSMSVRAGSSEVRIYTTTNRNRPLYTLVWYVGPQRFRRNSRYLDLAKDEAKRIAVELNSSRGLLTSITHGQCETFIAAEKKVAEIETPLLAAVSEYVECRKTLGDAPLLAAIQDYQKRTEGVRTGITVPQAAEEFLAAKKQDGASKRHLAQLKSDITRFAEAFTGPILYLKSHEIDAWLRKLGVAARTRNSTLTSIRTFFSWAKTNSYLPKNQETEAESVPKLRATDTEAEIFQPEELRKLLEAAHASDADVILFLVLGGFAGFRTAEIGRLDWSAVDFERRIITIRAG